MKQSGDTIIFDSGRTVYIGSDKIGIGHNMTPTAGYDSGIIGPWSWWLDDDPDDPDALTAAECAELADFMIARWGEFKKEWGPK